MWWAIGGVALVFVMAAWLIFRSAADDVDNDY